MEEAEPQTQAPVEVADPADAAAAATVPPQEAVAQAEADPADGAAAATDPPQEALGLPGPPSVAPVVVPRWVQMVALPLAVLGFWELARAAKSLTVIVIAAGVIALILNPLAKQLQRALPRALAIIVAYLAVLLVFAVIGAVLSAPVSTQISHFVDNFPHFVKNVNRDIISIQKWLNKHGIKVHIEKQGQSALKTLQKQVLKSSGSILSFSQDVLGKLLTLSVDLILTFVLSVYMLVYAPSIGELVRRWMPPGDGTPSDDYPLLVQHAVSGYVRGQLLFSLIMGGSAAIAMEVLGLVGIFPDGSRYAVFFGLFYGLMELIPYIGPIIGPIPPILVALATHPVSAIWVLGAFVVLQQLEGHIVAPQVFRISLRINPILVILVLLIGYQIYGIAGALLALPVATILRQTALYLRKHAVLESWAGGRAQP